MNFIDKSDAFSEIRGTGIRVDPSMSEFEAEFNLEYGANKWKEEVQPKIDRVLRGIFDMIVSIYSLDQKHPSNEYLHPNSAWSLTQPNASFAKAMYGVDIILRFSESDRAVQPVVLEVPLSYTVCYNIYLYYTS